MKYPQAHIAAIRQVMESMAIGDQMRYPDLYAKAGVQDCKEASLWVAIAKQECEDMRVYIHRRGSALGIERLDGSQSWRLLEQRNDHIKRKAIRSSTQAQNILREDLATEDRESVRSRWALHGLTAQTCQVPRRAALPATITVDPRNMLPPDPYKGR